MNHGTAIARLTNQAIGSIRRVHFRADSSLEGVEAPISLPTLEIETKSGRYVHLRNDAESRRLQLAPGPAVPDKASSATAISTREWQDLTAELPGAFDGRPVITRVEAVGADPTCVSRWVADAWVLQLSTGARLRFQPGATGPECTTLAQREDAWTS